MRNTRWLLYVLCLPWTLTVSYPLVGLLRLLGAAESLEWGKFGVLTATWTEATYKRWPYSTTLGHAIVFKPHGREDRRIVHHEDVHVRQTEDHMVVGFLLCLLLSVLGHWAIGLALWWSAGSWLLVGYLTAGIRWGWSQKSMYLGAEHERSAYAQTDVIQRDTPCSWEEISVK